MTSHAKRILLLGMLVLAAAAWTTASTLSPAQGWVGRSLVELAKRYERATASAPCAPTLDESIEAFGVTVGYPGCYSIFMDMPGARVRAVSLIDSRNRSSFMISVREYEPGRLESIRARHEAAYAGLCTRDDRPGWVVWSCTSEAGALAYDLLIRRAIAERTGGAEPVARSSGIDVDGRVRIIHLYDEWRSVTVEAIVPEHLHDTELDDFVDTALERMVGTIRRTAR